MLLKYTYAATPVQVVVDDVTEVQTEGIDSPAWLTDAGFDPDRVPAVLLVTYTVRGEVRSVNCKPGHVFLMNDSGKTIDKF